MRYHALSPLAHVDFEALSTYYILAAADFEAKKKGLHPQIQIPNACPVKPSHYAIPINVLRDLFSTSAFLGQSMY
jgi:hypothetical protein